MISTPFKTHQTLTITGFPVSILDYKELVDLALGAESLPFTIYTLNVPLLKEATDNVGYKDALYDATVIIPDGMGYVWASRLLYGERGLTQRVTGPDLFLEFCKRADQEGLSFFFLGSTPRVLKKITERLLMEYPNIKLAGTHAPPFGHWASNENRRMIDRVNRAGVDILWVGMTAPKQEEWIHQHKGDLQARVIGAIGAAFDFYAGSRKRAPLWMRKIGLEWFYRVCQEPLRLGRRYFTTIPYFLIRVLSDWLCRKGE